MSISRRAIATLCAVLFASSFFVGCDTQIDDGRMDKIELLEPIGASAQYDYVKERDMYLVDVYSSSVNPVVKEYSFAKEQTFMKYGAIPGQSVNEGDTLVYSETKSLDKQIESIEEEIDDLESNYKIESIRNEKNILDALESEEDAKEAYEKVARLEPDPCTIEHDMWEEQVHWPEYSYKNAIMRREQTQESVRQSKELYELEHKYKLESKQRIVDKVIDTTVVSDTAGEIVACNYYSNGDVIGKEVPILAVGDTSSKVLQTEYIAKSTIGKALDVYAVIDGKRYELDYINMEPEEYQQMVEDGDSVYTTFVLEDPKDEVSIGTYAIVVVEKDRRSKVLCVPNDAVKKEADSYYVYLFDGEESSYVPVEIGMKDGFYSEVISGLKAGDKILSDSTPKKTKNTATIERGDYSIDAQLNGFMYYPFSEWIVNPAQNGTTYLKEFLVSENEQVVKDQVLATIEVVPDQIEIGRLNTQISRLTSRLAEMNLTKAACDAKGLVSYELNIKISENERDTKIKRRQLSKLSKYSGIIEITAPYDGVVRNLESVKPGDILAPDSNIIEIANDSTSYIIVQDDKNQLNYGNDAQITVSSMSGPVTMGGKVVTVNKMCLTKELTNDYSLIAVPQEEMGQLEGSVLTTTGRWDRNAYKVNVKVRSEKNVLIVPKAAVTTKDKSTYVNVINSDGTVERKSFIPGGSDNNYYWVVDGLTEGMTVCWE